MYVKLKWILVLLLCINFSSYAQKTSEVKFSLAPVFGNIPFELGAKYFPFNKVDTIKFETLKFYISTIQLLKNGNVVYAELKSFHLVDVENKSSMTISLFPETKINFDEINFNLGIDSITNVSGAMGGDLDPTKGMYWTWQSGYINLKLEGVSNACPTLKNKFEFHLGGYITPYNSLQKIQIKVNSIEHVKIYFDAKLFFSSIDLTTQNQVMSPNQQAVDLSVLISKCFYTK